MTRLPAELRPDAARIGLIVAYIDLPLFVRERTPFRRRRVGSGRGNRRDFEE
ncbi:MAG TPA: hypothetical protein VL285_20765 [Bryobacteraceae bacterium]|nr:hypothetical protein [Bryobacteraceae bacterium]